jgi:hypothetical protein
MTPSGVLDRSTTPAPFTWVFSEPSAVSISHH